MVSFEQQSYGQFILEKDNTPGTKSDIYIPNRNLQQNHQALLRLQQINLLYRFLAFDNASHNYELFCTPLLKISNRVDLFDYNVGHSSLSLWGSIKAERDESMRRWMRGDHA